MSKQVVILGAGKSSRHLILYLADHAQELDIELSVVDIDLNSIPKIIKDHPKVNLFSIDPQDQNAYDQWVEKADVVLSMLPVKMHVSIAKLCLQHKTHLITPSYVSPEMKELNQQAIDADLIFLNEMGFDPGIDHLMAMDISNKIEEKKGTLTGYRSFVGGLIAPQSDDNPWKYKFTWSPMNVILAGQGGTSQYRQNKENRYVPSYALFSQNESIELSDGQKYDVYPNRDSLHYEKIYGWPHLNTLLRGTLRRFGFCKSWSHLVFLGLTDNSFKVKGLKGMNYASFYAQFYPAHLDKTNRNSLAKFLGIDPQGEDMFKLESIGFFDDKTTIELDELSPAEVLESILRVKWKMNPGDIDQSIMVHFFDYTLNDKQYCIESFLVVDGENDVLTSMSKLVGLPMAFACELILKNQIAERGVILPIYKDIYPYILNHLEKNGVISVEFEKEIFQ